MSSRGVIGEISCKGDREIEWTIKDFFSYTAQDFCYNSHGFDVSGSRWYLQIFPNGDSKDDSVGWIGLYLHREKSPFPYRSLPAQGVNFTLGVKRADGTVENSEPGLTWVFDEGGSGCGWPEVYERSELVRRRSELTPSDALTVTCSLRVYKDIHTSASMDTLSHDFLDMFISKRGSDSTLKVKEKEFEVHKCVLSARSPVFAAMFEVDMKEKNTGVVEIVDCDPEAFKDFVAYLYSGKAQNLSSNCFELYRIADKYNVESLKPDCLISIILNLTVENVCDAAALGDQFSVDTLKMKTEEFFNKNFKEIVTTARWETFLKENCLVANELLKKLGSQMEFTLKK